MSCPSMLLRILLRNLMLNSNISITFRKYELILYDNDAYFNYAVHKAFLDYCNEILYN